MQLHYCILYYKSIKPIKYLSIVLVSNLETNLDALFVELNLTYSFRVFGFVKMEFVLKFARSDSDCVQYTSFFLYL